MPNQVTQSSCSPANFECLRLLAVHSKNSIAPCFPIRGRDVFAWCSNRWGDIHHRQFYYNYCPLAIASRTYFQTTTELTNSNTGLSLLSDIRSTYPSRGVNKNYAVGAAFGGSRF
jgi:hypothetical protein